MTDHSPRYSAVAIALHWAIALAILFMIWLGWNMHDNESRFQLHKSIGITILILTIARILWRWLNPPPELPAEMKPLEKTASHLVHLGFYALMLAMPLTGWLTVSTHTEFDVPTVLYGTVSWPDIPGVGFLKNETAHHTIEFIHSKLAWLVFALLALHIAGALKHEFTAEEGVLKRMLPGLFGKTAPSRAPPKGFLIAFGSAFAVFAVIAGMPLIASALKPAPEAAQAEFTPNWAVDYANSSLSFSGVHDGNPYSGHFARWDAAIDFDPAQPEQGRVLVSVTTGSAVANQKLYTDSLKAPEWLDPDAFPLATVEINNITPAASGYTATATLTLKGIRVDVPLAFTLDIQGETATMTGHATLQRQPLDLGQQSDPDGDWVEEDIAVDVIVKALRVSSAG